MDTIRIFNTKDIPFGPFSDNYFYEMRIDNELSAQEKKLYSNTRDPKRMVWKSVSNYIYSNTITPATYKVALKNSKPTDVTGLYNELRSQGSALTMKLSTREGLNEKFKNQKILQDLIATGKSPIFYVSNNQLLGMGVDGKGENFVGKELEKIRSKGIVEAKESEVTGTYANEIDSLYKAYKADEFLKNELSSKYNNLSKYMVKNITLDTILADDKTPNDSNTKSGVEFLYKINKLPEHILRGVKNPYSLVLYNRRKGLRYVKNEIQNNVEKLVFDMYVNYTAEKNYLDEKVSRVKTYQFYNLPKSQLDNLASEIYKLYKSGSLPADLNKQIDEVVLFASETEIQEAETYESDLLPFQTEKEKTSTLPEEYDPENNWKTDLPIYVYNISNDKSNPIYQQFAPTTYTGMLVLEKLMFPTVTHYSTTKLFNTLPGYTLPKSYREILVNPNNQQYNKTPNDFLSIEEINVKFLKTQEEVFKATLQKYAKIGLDKKFQDKNFQDLLLNTKSAKLIWNDRSDSVLGVGPNFKGENFVGKYLEILRKYIKEYRSTHPELEYYIKDDKDLNRIISNDEFLKNWILMRVKDMCNSSSIMKQYVNFKYEYNVNLSTDNTFVSNVLKAIYKPCNCCKTKNPSIPVPSYFVTYVRAKCPNFGSADRYVVTTLWNFIIKTLYYIVENTKNLTDFKLKSSIITAQYILSSNQNCLFEGDTSDTFEDACTTSAMNNVINNIQIFNGLNSNYNKVGEPPNIYDVKTAENIILGSKPFVKKEEFEDVVKEAERIIEEEENEGESKEPDMEYNVPPKYSNKDFLEAPEGEDIGEDYFEDVPDDVSEKTDYDEDFDYIGEDGDQADSGLNEDDTEAYDHDTDYTTDTDKQNDDDTETEDEYNEFSPKYEDDFEIVEMYGDNDSGFIENRKIESTIKRTYPLSNSSLLTREISNSINTIKKYKMSQSIKQDRINFYADI